MASAGGKKKAVSQDEKKRSAGSGPAAARPKPHVGVTSRVGVSETWIRVFEQNEQCDEQERLTDQQISKHMKSEFPDLDAVTFDRVEIARGKYNRGGFHKKDKSGRVVRPKIHSRQHGSQAGSSSTTRPTSTPPAAAPLEDRVVSHQKDFKSHKK